MATRLREKAGALPARRLVEGTIELGGITPVAADDTVVIVVLAVHILAKLEVVELDPSGAGAVPGIPPAGGHADLVAIALDVHLVVVTGQHEILPKEGRVLFEELMLGAATAVLLAVLVSTQRASTSEKKPLYKTDRAQRAKRDSTAWRKVGT